MLSRRQNMLLSTTAPRLFACSIRLRSRSTSTISLVTDRLDLITIEKSLSAGNLVEAARPRSLPPQLVHPHILLHFGVVVVGPRPKRERLVLASGLHLCPGLHCLSI